MLESIENIDILKTGKNIDKEMLTSVDNFFVNFLKEKNTIKSVFISILYLFLLNV